LDISNNEDSEEMENLWDDEGEIKGDTDHQIISTTNLEFKTGNLLIGLCSCNYRYNGCETKEHDLQRMKNFNQILPFRKNNF
jgi:hypothetical protein